MGNNKSSKSNRISFWITFFRGMAAIFLGISLLIIPTKTGPMLANFMGAFWITTGLVSLRSDPVIPHKVLSRLIALFIIFAGLATITRGVSRQWIQWESLVNIIGGIVVMTGILHMYSGIKIGKQKNLGRTRLSVILGIFEVGLGVLFVLSDTGRSQTIYYVFMIWALIGGVMLIKDAFEQRSNTSQNNQVSKEM